MTEERVERRKIPRLGWRTTTFGVFIGRFWSLIAYSDTTPTRFMLALAASFWAMLLFLPGDTFQRPVYQYMRVVGGENAEAKWAFFWLLHAVGMWWRIFSSSNRPILSLLINVLGVLLFTAAAVSIYFTLTFPIPAAIAPDIAFALAAAWVLVRTHVNTGPGWRRD